MRPFDANPTRATRALQCYLILIGYAQRRQLVTYEDLSQQVFGHFAAGVMGQFLGPIMRYCEQQGIPALTSIVTNEMTGLPGEGFNTRRTPIHELHNDVFNFHWFEYFPPTEDDLGDSCSAEAA
jgi:hypothetical protein